MNREEKEGRKDSLVWSDDEVDCCWKLILFPNVFFLLLSLHVERVCKRFWKESQTKITSSFALCSACSFKSESVFSIVNKSWQRLLSLSLILSVVFDRPHEYDKSPFLKIYSLESVFKNLHICGRKRRLRVDRRCKRRKKSPISGYVWKGPLRPRPHVSGEFDSESGKK